MMRVVVSPPAPKAILCAFFFGIDDDSKLVKALPNWTILSTDQKILNPSTDVLWQEIKRLRSYRASLPVFLVGFSAGCQTVRSLIVSNPSLYAGVYPADGAHGEHPEPKPWQVQCWKDFADRARKGEAHFLISCTQNQYVESLPHPYESTHDMMERIVGLPFSAGEHYQEGNLYAECFSSASISKSAHANQQNVVVPDLLSRFWGPLFDTIAVSPVANSEPPCNPKPSIRAAFLQACASELANAQPENPPGSNWNDRIAVYHSINFVRNGKSIKALHAPWCAIALCYCLSLAGAAMVWRVSGIELENDAKSAHKWIAKDSPALSSQDLSGCIAVFKRGTEAWTRHVACVATSFSPDGSFETIGGNEGDTWKRTKRNLKDADLLGFVLI